MNLVRDAMEREPRWCFDDEPIDKAVARMRSGHLTRMPVVDRTLRLVGMLSIDDVEKIPFEPCKEAS